MAICLLIYFEWLKQYEGVIFHHYSLIPFLSVQGFEPSSFCLDILLNSLKFVALMDDLWFGILFEIELYINIIG